MSARKTQKDKEAVKPKKEKVVFDLPGQLREAPEENEPLRIFYESLYNQLPESEMAQIWMMEHGLLDEDEARRVLAIKQRRGSGRSAPAAGPASARAATAVRASSAAASAAASRASATAVGSRSGSAAGGKASGLHPHTFRENDTLPIGIAPLSDSVSGAPDFYDLPFYTQPLFFSSGMHHERDSWELPKIGFRFGGGLLVSGAVGATLFYHSTRLSHQLSYPSLLLAFGGFIVISGCISIRSTYFHHLCGNTKWWWESFFVPSFSSLFFVGAGCALATHFFWSGQGHAALILAAYSLLGASVVALAAGAIGFLASWLLASMVSGHRVKMDGRSSL
ncbi:unnamed protein product [Closterium sp. NIES-65]|nr:unnamed protein product [Closterium sp. NIES-65]